jgi:hypothetical protein
MRGSISAPLATPFWPPRAVNHKGFYSINGTAVSFVFNSGSSGIGTITGNTFTVDR